MIDNNTVIKKIQLIRYNLKRIEKYNQLSYEEFLQDEDAQDIICHNLFVALQYVIDLCSHIIADEGMGEPSYLSDMPDILFKNKVISQKLHKPLKEMIKFRNILAHEYGNLNMKIVYKIAREDISDLYRFIDEIIEYCGL